MPCAPNSRTIASAMTSSTPSRSALNTSSATRPPAAGERHQMGDDARQQAKPLRGAPTTSGRKASMEDKVGADDGGCRCARKYSSRSFPPTTARAARRRDSAMSDHAGLTAGETPMLPHAGRSVPRVR